MPFYVVHYVGKWKQKKFSEIKKIRKNYIRECVREERGKYVFTTLSEVQNFLHEFCGHLIFAFHNRNVLSLL